MVNGQSKDVVKDRRNSVQEVIGTKAKGNTHGQYSIPVHDKRCQSRQTGQAKFLRQAKAKPCPKAGREVGQPRERAR